MKLKIVLLLLLIIFLSYFHFRGLSIHDGGYIIHSAQRILNGETIYKDFDFVYTPGSVLLTAFIFKIFGQSIFIERVFSLLIALTTIFFLYKLLKKLTTNTSAQIIPVFIYIAWGPTHINFISPVTLSILTGISTISHLLNFSNKNNKNSLILAGLSTSLTILWKQNFGIALLLSVFIFFLINKPFWKKELIKNYLIGLIIPLFFLLIYFLFTNSFFSYINNLWFYTIKNIVIEQRLTTQFFYGNNIFQKLIKAAFYTIPLFLSIISLWLLSKQNKKFIFICLWVILYYLVSIRPETDFVHLVPILSIVGIPIVFIIQKKKMLGMIISLILVIVGLYTGLFSGYYKWEEPIVKNLYKSNNPRVNIWTDNRWKILSQQLTNSVNQNSVPSDFMYVNANAPLLYFISNRRNSTRYDFIIPYLIDDEYQNEIIRQIQAKNTKLVISEQNDPYITPVAQFIKINYEPIKYMDKFILWKMKPLIKEF